MLTPRQPVPALNLSTLDGKGFDLRRDMGENGALVVFYRGLHCPLCQKQLQEIEDHADRAAELGLSVVLVSGDGMSRAKEMAGATGVQKTPMGYDLTMTEAREWGLWISTAREGSDEPQLFNEPGIFHVLPDGTLYSAWVQSHPFARPAFGDILGMVKFRLDNAYPARGDYTGPLAEHDGGVMIEAQDGPAAEAYGT